MVINQNNVMNSVDRRTCSTHRINCTQCPGAVKDSTYLSMQTTQHAAVKLLFRSLKWFLETYSEPGLSNFSILT
jgi:hypothetical protein